MTNQERIEAVYLAEYNAAVVAFQAIERAIHKLPSPKSDGVTSSHAAEIGRIASGLESVLADLTQ